jgi:hypothetical protein
VITADQIVCHLVGDYILQSDWMAAEKTKQNLAAAVHAISYTVPFLFLSQSWAALLFIAATHFVIDRWRLARYVVWAKNFLAPWARLEISAGKVILDGRAVDIPAAQQWLPPTPPFAECSKTGYPPEKPDWMAVWLLIIADNTMHLICNGLALRYF